VNVGVAEHPDGTAVDWKGTDDPAVAAEGTIALHDTVHAGPEVTVIDLCA
jgi:hypothetical protein